MSESTSPSEKLRHSVANVDPSAMAVALDEGASPYERAASGPYAGLSALEMMTQHPNTMSFPPEMWQQVARSFNTLPQTRQDTEVLQSAVLQASQADAYTSTLAQSHQDMLPLAQSRRHMLSVAESSSAWTSFKAMMSFPQDFLQRQNQAQQEGRLEAELSLLNAPGVKKSWAPSAKPTFALGKNNNHQQEVNRTPSLSSHSYISPSEKPFVNQLDDGVFENKFDTHIDDETAKQDHDEVGDYHDILPKLNASHLKTHRKRRLGQITPDTGNKNAPV